MEDMQALIAEVRLLREAVERAIPPNTIRITWNNLSAEEREELIDKMAKAPMVWIDDEVEA